MAGHGHCVHAGTAKGTHLVSALPRPAAEGGGEKGNEGDEKGGEGQRWGSGLEGSATGSTDALSQTILSQASSIITYACIFWIFRHMFFPPQSRENCQCVLKSKGAPPGGSPFHTVWVCVLACSAKRKEEDSFRSRKSVVPLPPPPGKPQPPICPLQSLT